MRFFVGIGLLLLGGVFNVSETRPQKSTINNGVIAKLQRLSFASAPLSISSLSNENDGILSEEQHSWDKECIQTAGSDTFKDVDARMEEVIKQLFRQVNSEELELIVKDAKSPKNYAPVVKFVCSNQKTTGEFIRNMSAVMMPCYNAIDQDLNKALVNMTLSTLEYVCKDNGDAFITFLDNQGMECMNTRQNGLITCTDIIFDNFSQNSSDEEEDCRRKDNQLRNCARNEMALCVDSTNADFVAGFTSHVLSPFCGVALPFWESATEYTVE